MKNRNEGQEVSLWEELLEYESHTQMTEQERQALRAWVYDGNSVYENGSMVLNGKFWSPPTAHCFIHPNGNGGGIASPSHDFAAILFMLSYHSYVSA